MVSRQWTLKCLIGILFKWKLVEIKVFGSERSEKANGSTMMFIFFKCELCAYPIAILHQRDYRFSLLYFIYK